jgi:tetratricopeptide (TPR) repeat protein/TolB-like protein
MIGRTIGRFTVESKLGQGGMATVWRAEDTLLGRPVALKVLSESLASAPDQRRRFLREAKAAAALDHPAVAAVYDAGEHDGLLYIAFACIDGDTVSDLAVHGPLDVERVARIGADAADALDHAHRLGLLHRDVTGRNLMVSRDGRAFVLDFGLAHVAESSRLTNSGVTLGTLAYLAPEVLLGGEAGVASDLYGLGVVLYEALTGALPFVDSPPGALVYAAVNRIPEAPSLRRMDGDARLDAVVLRLLEKRPEDRYGSGRDVREALEHAMRHPPALEPAGETGRVGVGGRDPAPRRRREDRPETRALPRVLYLAVLPFEDTSSHDADGEREAFARGLSQALTASLANVDELHLVAVPAGEDGGADPVVVARRLGANLVLRGGVRRAGSHLRISYAVTNVVSGVPFHGDTLDGTADDLFELEDRVVRSVMRALDLDDSPEAARRGKAPRDPAAHEHYVQALGYLQRPENEAHVDAAIGLLERLSASADRSASIHAALGRAYLMKCRLTSHVMWESKAAEQCHLARSLDSLSPDVLVTLGDLSVSVGRHREAMGLYEQALGLKPELPEALLGIARACEGEGRFEDAIDACRRAIALRPELWTVHNRLGLVRFSQGRFQEALESWRRVLALTPDNPWAHSNIASALFHLGHLPDAIDSYRQSLAVRPTASAYSNLGGAYFYSGRFEEAADAFERAVALQPNEPLWWGNLGSACAWIPGRSERAHEALERAITGVREHLTRNPRSARQWSFLASWLANRGGDPAGARGAIERALEIAPSDTSILATAGEVYEQIGERDAALRHLQEAMRGGYGESRLIHNPYLASLREDPRFESIRRSPSSA